METNQKAIASWFDSVYRRKGVRYLRPVRAYHVFLELLRLEPNHRLLDVACGPGVLLRAASDYTAALHGIDISPVAIEQAKRRTPGVRVAVANAERLPFRDAAFDRITCLGSLERMLNASRALEEMRRVGNPGARYCFLVRNSNTFSWKFLAPMLQARRRQAHAGADSLRNWWNLFEASGFRVLEVWPDQYPLHRRKRAASLWLQEVDFRKPVLTGRPLERANEFIFVLDRNAQ